MSQNYVPAGNVGTPLIEMTDAEATGTFGDEWGQTNVRTTGNKIRFINDDGTLGTGIAEYGTWTPGYGGTSSNPTVTYGSRAATYTKIGKLVICHLYLVTTAASGGTGTLTVTGLPFTSSSGALNGFAGNGYATFAESWTTAKPVGARVLGGDTVAYLSSVGTATDYAALTPANLTDGTTKNELHMTIIYRTA